MTYWKHFVIFSVLVLGCKAEDKNSKKDPMEKPTPPAVTDGRSDLVLSWFSDGGAGLASSVSQVPNEARAEVRVQDPSIPPEKRNPDWIFIANLTKPDASGKYPVRVELRSAYETKRHKVEDMNKTVIGQTGSNTQALVVMYSTSHCPVCKQARRWLLEQKIPYVEKDLEADAQAAIELAKKGKAQGISTNGVPIFEIRGNLVPGFDPAAIMKLIGTTS